MTRLEALLILSELKGFGTSHFRYFAERGLRPEEMIEACREDPRFRLELLRILESNKAAREIEKHAAAGVDILGFGEENYPKSLNAIHDPPLILYLKGEILADDLACFAIVGSRHPSRYGIETASKFASALACSGLTIISGFAKGIDSEAHRAALKAGKKTVAVLGCGVDVVYPRENQTLYRAICERGGFISEYPIGTEPFPGYFPKRNRLISGLSAGVLVVEAHEKSGSLITADLAVEQGKEVFAIPGRIDSLASRGANALIKKGACLVQSPEEILAELAPVLKGYCAGSKPESRPEELPGIETGDSVLDSLIDRPLTLDELSLKNAVPAQRLLASLTRLELAKKVRKLPNGRYGRVLHG